MTSAIFVNGRFLGQKVTGVQRFALEMTAAMDRLAVVGEWPDTTLLTPKSTDSDGPGRTPLALRRLQTRQVGKMRGQAWEQIELAGAARRGTLINLANTGPLAIGSRQVVVLHDAGVFDTPESYSLRFRLWYKALQRRLVSSGATVVTVSGFSQRRISRHLGVDPKAIQIVYEGADHILRAEPDPDVLQRHDLRPGKFVLVVGAGAAHKNLEAMRGAADVLSRRGLVLAVAGASGLTSVFQDNAACKQFGRPLGRVSDGELRALYESALCLLFPSRYEGFGLPPVEAMACGCPVVASDGGAVEEICGAAALYVDACNLSSVAVALERLIDEPELSTQLRLHGTTRAATFTWDASARRLGAAVQRLL